VWATRRNQTNQKKARKPETRGNQRKTSSKTRHRPTPDDTGKKYSSGTPTGLRQRHNEMAVGVTETPISEQNQIAFRLLI